MECVDGQLQWLFGVNKKDSKSNPFYFVISQSSKYIEYSPVTSPTVPFIFNIPCVGILNSPILEQTIP